MSWKPDRAEAQFLGELLALDAKLAEIARGMLEKGNSLASVVDCFKSASKIAAMMRKS